MNANAEGGNLVSDKAAVGEFFDNLKAATLNALGRGEAVRLVHRAASAAAGGGGRRATGELYAVVIGQCDPPATLAATEGGG